MPSVPMEMPSLTPIVLKRRPTMPAAHAFLHLLSEPQQVHIAGIALIPNTGDAHLRLRHIRLAKAGRIEHGLGGALRFGLCNLRTVFVQHFGRFAHNVQCIVCFSRVGAA